jgi:cell division protein FtsW
VERIERRPGDFLLFITLILLVGIGLSVLFSASFYNADRLTGNPYHLFRRQALFILLGGLGGFVVSRTPVRLFDRLAPGLLLVSLILMVLPFLPFFGRPILGARRWILLFGMSFQPSEVAKLAVVLYLARIFGRKEERIHTDPLNSLVPPLIVVALLVGLTYLQNDYSTAFFLLFIALAVFYAAGVRLRYFFLVGSIAVPVAGLLLFSKAHRVQRLITFLNPLADPTGSGFQVIAARSALVSGGFWGQGLGRGVKKLGGLPEAHSDFIFAVAGEEMGFIGATAILLLFLVFAWRGYRIALRRGDSFRTCLSFGITSLVFCQALLNIAVAAGLVPATGIPLPFFSSGGSSVLVTLLMCGLLYNLSRESAGAEPWRGKAAEGRPGGAMGMDARVPPKTRRSGGGAGLRAEGGGTRGRPASGRRVSRG